MSQGLDPRDTLAEPPTEPTAPVYQLDPEPDSDPVPDHNAGLSMFDRLAGKDGSTKAPPKPRAKKKAVPKTKPGALVGPLEDMYTTVGLMLMPLDPVCTTAIVNNAHECAVAVDALAQQNDAVRRVVLAITQTGAWGGVLVAHLPMLLVVATHHGPKQVSEVTGPLAVQYNPKQFPPETGEPETPSTNGAAQTA